MRFRRWLLCGAGGIVVGGDVGVCFCEIAAAGADLVALGFGVFGAYLVVLAVDDIIGGDVGDGVLVAELVADVLEGLVEIVDVVGEEGAAAGFLGDIVQDFVALGEVRLAVGGFLGIGLGELNPLCAGADGVDDHAGALRHLNGFGAGVIGKIVVAVADENHDAANDVGLVARRPRGMAELGAAGFVNRVVDGGAAAGAGLDDFVAEAAGVIGEGLD